MFDKRIKGHHRPSAKKMQIASRTEFEEFLQTSPKNEIGVIYIHVPFCDNICSFCSMNRSKLEDELDEYTQFLLEQFDKFGKTTYMQGKKIDSVYFGGGTPTTLKERHLEPIINSIHKNFNILPTCEFSLESTLHNLNLSKLRLLNDLGVNRFSIGIQTFSQNGRKLLNRVHDTKGAIEHLQMIRENFDGIMCTDTIFNYPNQTLDEVLEDARLVQKLGVDSTSFYSLQFLEGSVLSQSVSEDYYDLNHEKKLHHAFVNALLDTKEYEILEYTKLNKIGRDEYKYIRLSHAAADILPIGKGAGGQIGNYAIYNPSTSSNMITRLSDMDIEFIKLTSLFQYPKISLNEVRKYLSDECFENLFKFFKKCEEQGYMNIENDSLKYTLDGIFWGNSIANEVTKMTRGEF